MPQNLSARTMIFGFPPALKTSAQRQTLCPGLRYGHAAEAHIADVRVCAAPHKTLEGVFTMAGNKAAGLFDVRFLYCVAGLGFADHAQVFHYEFLL